MIKFSFPCGLLAALVAAGLAGCGPQVPSNPAAEQAAAKAATAWLGQLDAGNFTGTC